MLPVYSNISFQAVQYASDAMAAGQDAVAKVLALNNPIVLAITRSLKSFNLSNEEVELTKTLIEIFSAVDKANAPIWKSITIKDGWGNLRHCELRCDVTECRFVELSMDSSLANYHAAAVELMDDMPVSVNSHFGPSCNRIFSYSGDQ